MKPEYNPLGWMNQRDVLELRGDTKTLLILDAVEIVEDVCSYACAYRGDDLPPDLPCESCLLAARMRAEIEKEAPSPPGEVTE